MKTEHHSRGRSASTFCVSVLVIHAGDVEVQYCHVQFLQLWVAILAVGDIITVDVMVLQSVAGVRLHRSDGSG